MHHPVDSQKLCEWYNSPLGKLCLKRERQLVQQACERFFGYHQLECLVHPSLPIAEDSLLGHRILAVPQWQPGFPESTLICESHELPLENDSIDLVVLHHTLDLSEDPHQSVREASRVLRSGGHLVIVGFNPYSLWGLLRWLRRGVEPWNLRFLSSSRVEDWLSLLEFRVKRPSLSMIEPPINNSHWLQRLGFMERWVRRLRLPIGAFYVSVAQKQVGGRIMKKPEWRRSRLMGVAGVRPAIPFNSRNKSE